MLAVRTPEAPPTAREDAVFDSAFPFAGQGRLLRSRSISGLFSRSLHSGLQPPCLRFAAAVTGRHARLGSRLLARLCRGRHRRRQTSTRLQGATRSNPMMRAGSPWDIAEACVYLAGPSGGFVTGETLTVDGGGQLWGETWTTGKPAYFSGEDP